MSRTTKNQKKASSKLGFRAAARVDFRIPVDLHEWVKSYAEKNSTTVTRIIINHILDLKKREEHVEQF